MKTKPCDVCECGCQRWVHLMAHKAGCNNGYGYPDQHCDCCTCATKECRCRGYRFHHHCYEEEE